MLVRRGRLIGSCLGLVLIGSLGLTACQDGGDDDASAVRPSASSEPSTGRASDDGAAPSEESPPTATAEEVVTSAPCSLADDAAVSSATGVRLGAGQEVTPDPGALENGAKATMCLWSTPDAGSTVVLLAARYPSGAVARRVFESSRKSLDESRSEVDVHDLTIPGLSGEESFADGFTSSFGGATYEFLVVRDDVELALTIALAGKEFDDGTADHLATLASSATRALWGG